MYTDLFVQDEVEEPVRTAQTALSELRAARGLFKQNRKQGYAALNSLFRAGIVPEPTLDGPYVGELLALDVAPGLTQLRHHLSPSCPTDADNKQL